MTFPQGPEQEPAALDRRPDLSGSLQPGGLEAPEEQHQQTHGWSVLRPGTHENPVSPPCSSIYVMNYLKDCGGNHITIINSNMYDCLSSNSVGKKKKKKVLNIYSNRGEICILSKVGMFLCASFAVVNYSNFMSGP